MLRENTTSHVLFKKINQVGVIKLNRPKVLNVLDAEIIIGIWRQLLEWEKDTVLVIIKGAGKSFCAGGDVKQATNDLPNGMPFTYLEYNLNFLISTLKIPYVALLDGFAMGGGLGLSIHGKYRVATENTVIAMPESRIGFIPDVGGTYFLPRFAYHLGYYLALTSNKMKGEDALIAGIATHFVPSARLPELEASLTECKSATSVNEVLTRFHKQPGKSALEPHLDRIDYCFAAPTVEDVITRLEAANDQWCSQISTIIRGMCPISLKLTLQALCRGAQMDLWQCLKMEYRLTRRLSKEYNFKEGVRALLVDKDNNPKWIPSTLEEIKETDLQNYFDPLPNNEDLTRINTKTSKI